MVGLSERYKIGEKYKVLVVDDEENMVTLLSLLLEDEGYIVKRAKSGPAALSIMESEEVDLVISDLVMLQMDGLKLLNKTKEIYPYIPFIIITGFGTIPSTVKAMRDGAYDYITKPFDNAGLISTVKKALEYRSLTKGVSDLDLQKEETLEGGVSSNIKIIFRHEKMIKLFRLIRAMSMSDATVLIYGESGVGKELAARAIHTNSNRREGPFIPIDCASLPEPLLESELFGHLRGAFTDAVDTKKGLFEEADGGTIFLDEISATSLFMQSKLLRVLQEREIKPVGGNKYIKVDIRVIAAANKDLREEIRQRTFREDLYYRLSVVPLYIPPLRERKEDIPLLVNHFIKKYQGSGDKVERFISPQTLQLLMEYPWPGNIRELENAIERGSALCQGPELTIDSLFLSGHKEEDFSSPGDKEGLKGLVNKTAMLAEKGKIIETLIISKGNMKLTAKLLKISRAGLYTKMRRFDIDVEKFRGKFT